MYDTLIEITMHDAVCVVAVMSEIDIANAETFGRYVDEASAHAEALVLSLASCPYMDSSGIRPIAQLAAARGDSFSVVAPHGTRVRRVFDVLGLGSRFDVHESVSEALTKTQRKSAVA